MSEIYYKDYNYKVLKCFKGYCLEYKVETNENGRVLTLTKSEYDLWNNKIGNKLEDLKFVISKDEYEEFKKICSEQFNLHLNDDKYDFELVNKDNDKLIVKNIDNYRCSYTIVNNDKELTIDFDGSTFYKIDDLVCKEYR